MGKYHHGNNGITSVGGLQTKWESFTVDTSGTKIDVNCHAQWQEKGVFNIRMLRLCTPSGRVSFNETKRREARIGYVKAIVAAGKPGFPHFQAFALENMASHRTDMCERDDAG